MNKNRTGDFQRELEEMDEKKVTDARVKAMSKIIDEYKMRLDGLVKPKVTLPKLKKKLNDKESFIRVVFGDTHGSKSDPQAINAFLGDMEIIRPREMMCLGDLVDCGGFLAQHHTMGYVDEMGYTYEDDIHMSNMFLDRALPLTTLFEFIEGNHDRRPEKWCTTAGLKAHTDGEWLAQHLLETEKNAYVPATVKKGKSIYCHTGCEKGASNPKKLINLFHTNVAFGHTHRAVYETVREGGTGKTLVGRNYGCLCQLQPLWRNTDPTGWTHGYGLEVIKPDGSFWAIPVPIMEGVSQLSQFTDILNL